MSILKRLLIVFIFFSFFVSALTGIIKFPEAQRYFLLVYNYWPAATVSAAHDWSSLILVFLIMMHLILKREGLKKAFWQGRWIPGKALRIFGIIILVAFALYIFKQMGAKKLAAVEIKEYQGEKLGSADDFRENSIKGPQYLDKNSYRLEITGLTSTPATYSYADLLKLPAYQKVVTINCVEGWSVKALWEGILVKDVLQKITIKPEAKTIIFYAADGYSTSFPLSYVLENNIMMAAKLNGADLPPARGFPFQLVAEQKWGYKWIKWITKIELSSDTNYKGFWESRGYNNEGDLTGSKFSP